MFCRFGLYFDFVWSYLMSIQNRLLGKHVLTHDAQLFKNTRRRHGYFAPCILQWPPVAGAAVACPDRPVINLQADGSGMYTLQALWTQARENLNVTTIIFANRKYAILQIEFGRVGAHNPGPKAMSMLDLSNPELNWVSLAEGMGVAAWRATTLEEFNTALEAGLRHNGPALIEALV